MYVRRDERSLSLFGMTQGGIVFLSNDVEKI